MLKVIEMEKVLFKHELKDAWGLPISSITILDMDKDNVMIDEDQYTLPMESINAIKELLKNPDLQLNNEILNAPVLDGTSHKIQLNDKEIDCFNLWYWNEEGAFDDYKHEKKVDIEYKKIIVTIFI